MLKKTLEESGGLKDVILFKFMLWKVSRGPSFPLVLNKANDITKLKLNWHELFRAAGKSSCSSSLSLILKGGELEGSGDNTRGEEKIDCCPKPHKL